MEEAEFSDAVARNLARGRMLVIVLGDGIRAETEVLGDLLSTPRSWKARSICASA